MDVERRRSNGSNDIEKKDFLRRVRGIMMEENAKADQIQPDERTHITIRHETVDWISSAICITRIQTHRATETHIRFICLNTCILVSTFRGYVHVIAWTIAAAAMCVI